MATDQQTGSREDRWVKEPDPGSWWLDEEGRETELVDRGAGAEWGGGDMSPVSLLSVPELGGTGKGRGSGWPGLASLSCTESPMCLR